MKVKQFLWTKESQWQPSLDSQHNESVQLVLIFGSKANVNDSEKISQIRRSFPKAFFCGCSTSGEIHDTNVLDDSLSVTSVEFEKTCVKSISLDLPAMTDSLEVGKKVAQQFPAEELVHVFVLSEGIHVNGSELVKGLTSELPNTVAVTGGLSGDADRFEETFIIDNDTVTNKKIVALGFYGKDLHVGYGSLGGWDTFGPERLITKSESNILFELDNQSALSLYKKYLGEHAEKLPSSALLFPLGLKLPNSDEWVIRTILGINESDQSMTFAGDLPEGSFVRLMKANFERLIDGAKVAAESGMGAIKNIEPDLAILISCVGRKMVLGPRTEEEVEEVRNILGDKAILTGFYSYGEISPFTPEAKCSSLHNQTMTITILSENK